MTVMMSFPSLMSILVVPWDLFRMDSIENGVVRELCTAGSDPGDILGFLIVWTEN